MILESPIKAVVRQNDFLFQVYLEKTVYKVDEHITVRFNLTYLGESAITVRSPNINDVFHLRIWNETHSIDKGQTKLPAFQSYTLTRFSPILGRAEIGGDNIVFYLGNSGPGGGIIPFSSGSTYYLEGSVSLSLEKDGEGLYMTAPQLTIMVTDELQ